MLNKSIVDMLQEAIRQNPHLTSDEKEKACSFIPWIQSVAANLPLEDLEAFSIMHGKEKGQVCKAAFMAGMEPEVFVQTVNEFLGA